MMPGAAHRRRSAPRPGAPHAVPGAARWLKRLVLPDGAGDVVRKAGIMTVVARGGTVAVGDGIEVELPVGPHHRLQMV